MKQILYLLMSSLLFSCTKTTVDSTIQSCCVSLIDDRTDSFALSIEADPILRLFGFSENKEKEATLRYVLITDKKLNPINTFHLEDGISTERENKNDIVQFREQLIRSFYKQIRKGLHQADQPIAKSYQHSECFYTITSELTALSQSKSTERILIVYSDLQENSDLFNCYSIKGYRMLIDYREKVKSLFDNSKHLPDNLKGIRVYFVFQPNTRQEDNTYLSMFRVYKSLLKERGAIVSYQATSKNYLP